MQKHVAKAAEFVIITSCSDLCFSQIHCKMVAVAQSVEHQIVALDVAGSSPVGHPF
jgi:hypothetical protein